MYSLKKLKNGDSYIKYYSRIPKKLILNKESYQELWNIKPDNFGKIKIFGKETNTPRWFQNYGHSYNFSNLDHESKEIPTILRPYLEWVNEQEKEFNYNGILVNWYQDGSHYIGKHSDDEKDLVKNSPIYGFSFGESRPFHIHSKLGEEKYKFNLLDNSLIIMGGECQKYYTHSINKSKKKLNSRISITIRAFK